MTKEFVKGYMTGFATLWLIISTIGFIYLALNAEHGYNAEQRRMMQVLIDDIEPASGKSAAKGNSK